MPFYESFYGLRYIQMQLIPTADSLRMRISESLISYTGEGLT